MLNCSLLFLRFENFLYSFSHTLIRFKILNFVTILGAAVLRTVCLRHVSSTMATTSGPKYCDIPPWHITFFRTRKFLRTHKWLRVHNFSPQGKFKYLNFFLPFLDYLRLRLFTWKFTCQIFLRSVAILHIFWYRSTPLLRNLVVSHSGDVPMRSCAVPDVPVENLWAKYT